MTDITLKKQLASWLKSKMVSEGLRNVDVETLAKGKVDNMSAAYVANMKSIGMSLAKAHEVAEIMAWDPPTVVGGHVLDESPITSENCSETSIVISSLHPVAGVNSHNNEYEVLEQIKIPTEWLRSSYPNISNLSNLALCSISGDSMEPTFKALDTVLVDTTVQNFDYDVVFVFTYHNTFLIKRAQAIPGTGFKVKSDNSALYDPFYITDSDVDNLEVHGRVVGNFSFNKV